ncbi:hypothetical protein L596_023815 [Steinernema carpocapsae]|uniref:ABC transporter domain-containing protein n=1 Tax=Steinernema carpocapsae TaxID=34508 RepID=A0A4U5MES6_STECR|nr:hypothetical protein L596_023815 [Steinernema carpocapsae]
MLSQTQSDQATSPTFVSSASQRSSASSFHGAERPPSKTDVVELPGFYAEDRKSLVWKDIEVSVPKHYHDSIFSIFSKSRKERRQVIFGVSGAAEPGELLAIMGESGAGKTTLLNILTRRNKKGLQWSGEMNVNGEELSDNKMMKISAFVEQVDMFCNDMTVKEHLTFSAHLRMNPRYSYEEREERVRKVIEDMGLQECQDRLIAARFGQKISMGEMKRLSFACEVLTDPSIFFFDEPTSGLDSFMAHQVISTLKHIAARGKTVLMTVHQPSSQVFDMFDKVCLMSMGKVAYFGRRDQIGDFFASAGFPVPPFTNTADHIVKTVAVRDGFDEEGIVINATVRKTFESSQSAKELKAVTHAPILERREKWANEPTSYRRRFAAPWMRQLYWCTKRHFVSSWRDPLILKVRLASVIVASALIGFVNFRTPLNKDTVMVYNGILFFSMLDMQFSFMVPCIHVMFHQRTSALYSGISFQPLQGRRLFYREEPRRSTAVHRVSDHLLGHSRCDFWSHLLAQTPDHWLKFSNFTIINIILTNLSISVGYAGSCLFTNVLNAVNYLLLSVIPLLIFCGYYITKVPKWITWLSYFSWFKYAFQAQVLNLWKGVAYVDEVCEGEQSACLNGVDGPDVIKKYVKTFENQDSDYNWIYINMAILIVFTIIFRILGVLALTARAKFSS